MAEITIKGAGILGLSIAFVCLRRGATVEVVDPTGPGGGASGGIVGALAPHVPENWNPKKAFQLDSLLLAESFWREVEEVAGISSGYARTGRVQPIEDDAALRLARRRSEAALSLWKGRAEWRIETASDFEFAPRSPTGLVVHDTLSARLHPRQACAALARAVTALGGRMTQEAQVRGLVVDATGVSGLKDLSSLLGVSVGTGIKGQAALLAYDVNHAPQIFADTLHVIPHADGTTAIGSTSERQYTGPDQTDTQLDGLIERVRRAVPCLATAPVLERWAGVRPRARSRAPMLGPCPVRPNHFIANGGFKIGFGMAPKIAEVMADLILDGQDNIPIGFRVEDSVPVMTECSRGSV
ncbi:MAG: FAD-dependent oxidoreductase [Pseudomonadota bacterium]